MSGRPPDPKKREKILSAAIALFLKEGYHDTTTAHIAERAGMSSSHMYIYFRDKEDLLIEAVRRMRDEHTALSTRLAEKSAGLDDAHFIDMFYEAQVKLRQRVRFIIHCMLTPGIAPLLDSIDFDYSEVFIPFLKEWPAEQASRTAWALMSISVSYFLGGGIDDAKAVSLTVLRNARANVEGASPHAPRRVRTPALHAPQNPFLTTHRKEKTVK